MQRRDDDIGRKYDHGESEPDTAGQEVKRDKRADDRNDDGDASVEHQPVAVDAHAPGDQGRHTEQSGKVEDVRSDNDADTRLFVPRNHRSDGGGDLRRVGPERRHHPQQRFREAEPLADPIESPREHDARRHGEHECGRE